MSDSQAASFSNSEAGVDGKQQIIGALVKYGFVHMRGEVHVTFADWFRSRFSYPNRWRYNYDLVNLLHRLGETVHTSEYTDLDISFLNHAVPLFLARRANRRDLRLLDLLVRLHDAVPSELSDQITWHPPEAMRMRLREWSERNERLSAEFAAMLVERNL